MNTLIPSLVIVGGGYAGVLAAIRASRRLRGKANITLISDDDRLVERIRLHQRAASGTTITHPLSHLLRGTEVILRKGRVTAIDRDTRTVYWDSHSTRYDRLILAVGSVANGTEDAARFALGIEDPSLEQRLRADERGSMTIAGGGLVGVELAAEVAERWPSRRITIVTNELASELGESARSYVRTSLQRLGVEVREDCTISGIEEGALRLNGERVPFDLCVWTLGMSASPLARATGLTVTTSGQALVSRSLRSLDDDAIYVVGDASALSVPFRYPVPMGCKSAMPLGAHAAENAAADLARAYEIAPHTADFGSINAESTPFSWRHPGTCVSLGRNDGVIERRGRDGMPASTMTGRTAAFVKEMVCRSTMFSLTLERFGIPYQWLREPRTMTNAQLTSGASS